MNIILFIANHSGYILLLAVIWMVIVECIKKYKIKKNLASGNSNQKEIRRKITYSLLGGLTYSNFLLIIMNILIASSTVAAYSETVLANNILNRPYLSIEDVKLQPLQVQVGDNGVDTRITFIVRNNGATPSLDVQIQRYFIINDIRQDYHIENNDYIGPDQFRRFTFEVDKNIFEKIKSGSGNYFYYNVIYKDYSGKSHLLKTQLQSIGSGGTYEFVVVAEHEE